MAKQVLPATLETDPLLRHPDSDDTMDMQSDKSPTNWRRAYFLVAWIVVMNLLVVNTAFLLLSRWPSDSASKLPPFHFHVKSPQGICNSENGEAVSHSGYIGLQGDSDENPKRSFFWYFEAQRDPENAPVILAVGGGPGTSGMSSVLRAQGHCLITQNGTVPNQNAWTERFNLAALDHPIGVGFSYGTMVNNSRAAAVDVYDFLQKFYSLYPDLVKNKLILSGGSYAGTYIPHIATVIHEQNRFISLGKGYPGAVHINLESLMLSNPTSDAASRFRWWLHQACYNTNLYNATTCTELFAVLPQCLDGIQFAYENSTPDTRFAALSICRVILSGDTHGTMTENVDKKCDGSKQDCFPEFTWLEDFMNLQTTKEELGVPPHRTFRSINKEVTTEFVNTGDLIQPAYLLYEPLLRDGIRLLHYIGAKDANCGWPSVLSFLKLLRSPYQESFIHAPDIPWYLDLGVLESRATVRAIGEGAGVFTYILVADAGHFVAVDQPTLAKTIVEHWIDNRPFL